MIGNLRPLLLVLGLSSGAVLATTAHGEERWQDPNACTLQAATFNIATLKRLNYKEGQADYPTTVAGIAAVLADDPCVVLHNLTDGGTALATATLVGTRLETPIDLITFGQLGSNPYNFHVLSAYQPVRPSDLNCNVDDRTLTQIDDLRLDISSGARTSSDASQDVAVLLWHDGCAIGHMSPANIIVAGDALADPANFGTTSAVLVAKYFQR